MKLGFTFLAAVLGFGLVAGVLHNRLPDPVTWGLGFFVMLLIGYPLQKVWTRNNRLTFPRWLLISIVGGVICTALGFLIQRVF